MREAGAGWGIGASERLAEGTHTDWPHCMGDHPKGQLWGPSFAAKEVLLPLQALEPFL